MPLGAVLGPATPYARLRVVTPLGIRFHDVAGGAIVADGLVVTAVLAGTRVPPVSAHPSLSGVFTFNGLPGTRPIEYPTDTGEVVASIPAAITFTIRVFDTLDRFLPTVFSVDVPHGTGVPVLDAVLFSAPTRTVAPGFAAIRGFLWDVVNDQPAAYAALDVNIEGVQHRGIANDGGTVLVLFPYPLVQQLTLGSPPGVGLNSLAAQTWPIDITAAYSTGLAAPLGGLGAVPPWDTLPSIKSIYGEASPALLYPDLAAPPVDDWSVVLTYGEELILRTVGQSYLAIAPGTSPV